MHSSSLHIQPNDNDQVELSPLISLLFHFHHHHQDNAAMFFVVKIKLFSLFIILLLLFWADCKREQEELAAILELGEGDAEGELKSSKNTATPSDNENVINELKLWKLNYSAERMFFFCLFSS